MLSQVKMGFSHYAMVNTYYLCFLPLVFCLLLLFITFIHKVIFKIYFYLIENDIIKSFPFYDILLRKGYNFKDLFVKVYSIFFSGFIFYWSLLTWLAYTNESIGWKRHYLYRDIDYVNSFRGILEIDDIFVTGVDSISIFFLILTSFIFFNCFLFIYDESYRVFELCLLYFILEFFLMLSFITLDLLYFYILFEALLWPMFIIIGIWGSRSRKIKAAYYLFFYTFISSLFFLISILYIYKIYGTTNFLTLYQTLRNSYMGGSNGALFSEKYFITLTFFSFNYTFNINTLLCLGLFISFATKIPMFPFHIWLPEAHVEASTTGSVILASLILKLGGYGFIRFLLPLFPLDCYNLRYLVYFLSIISVIIASFNAMVQLDIKKLIAYASIAHMNLGVLGIFSFNVLSISGSVFMMLAHGLTSGALFFSVGVLYKRFPTKLIYLYGGISKKMPIFSVYFFLFCLANFSFPGTGNFAGEFFIFIGLGFTFKIIFFLVTFIGMFTSIIYTM